MPALMRMQILLVQMKYSSKAMNKIFEICSMSAAVSLMMTMMQRSIFLRRHIKYGNLRLMLSLN